MDRLLAAALVGTARRSDAPPRTGTPADRLIGALDLSLERTTLLAAGAAAICAQAGRLPDPAPARPAAAPDETLAGAGAGATALLGDLFAAHVDVLPEALTLLARSGRRLPPSLLVAALGAADPALRAALRPVLGARGRWLAAHNPAWRWACDVDPSIGSDPSRAEVIWQEGSPQQRIALIAHVRGSHPAQARTWLAATLRREKADLRHDLLKCMAVNLSPDDEPFLESVLDDRAERVRVLAARLLARLPSSALADRTRERANCIISFDRDGRRGALGRIARAIHGGHNGGELSIAPPHDVDGRWLRDGIAAAPQGTPEVEWPAWWMRQVLGLVPPSHWSARFECDPETLIAAAGHTEWERSLIDAWSEAALLHREPAWAGTLWDWWLDEARRTTQRHEALQQRMLVSLLLLIPPPQAERRVAPILMAEQSLGRSGGLPEPIRRAMIAALPAPWSAGCSDLVLDSLHRFVTSRPRGQALQTAIWPQQLQIVAAAIAPSCLTDELALWQTPDYAAELPDREGGRDWHAQRWAEALARFVETLRLRRRIQQELAG